MEEKNEKNIEEVVRSAEEVVDDEDTSETSDKTKSYRILGLEPGVSDDVVKNKYGALLRQYKQKTDEYGVTDEDAAYYEKITKAYDDIMGITHDFSFYDPSSSVPYGLQKFWAKVCAFCDQYNVLLITLGILVIGGIFFAVQVVSNGKEDLKIKFVGAYGTASENTLKKEIDRKSEAVDNVQLSFYTVTTGTSFDQTSQSQATAFLSQLMSGSLDLVLIDKESFDVYVAKKSFKDIQFLLDEYYAENPDAVELETYTYSSEKGADIVIEEGVYGIDVTTSKFFDDTKLAWLYDEEKGQEKSMILTFCHNTEKSEKAEEFAKEIFKTVTPSEKKVDLSLKFVGAYGAKDQTALKKEIDEKSQAIENAELSFFNITTATSFDPAIQTQATEFLSQVMSGSLDVILIDKESFDVYVKQKSFKDIQFLLDEYYAENPDVEKLEIFTYSSAEGDEIIVEEGVYGIDITDSTFFDGADLSWLHDEVNGQMKSMILTFCNNSEKSEKAEEFAKEIFNAIP